MLFKEGRQIIFLAHETFGLSFTQLTKEILQLKKKVNLTHVALQLPVDLADKLPAFIRGEIPVNFWPYDITGVPVDLKDENDVARNMDLRLMLQKLDGHVSLVLFGDREEEVRGQLALEAQAGQIRRIIEQNPRARILTVGSSFDLSKEDLLWESGSLVKLAMCAAASRNGFQRRL